MRENYLYLSGDAQIGEIHLDTGNIINIDGVLSNAEPYKLVMDLPGVFTKGASGQATEANFVSGVENYDVAVGDGGELMLKGKPHRHADGKDFEAFVGGYLEDGSYYAATDRTEGESVIAGDVVDFCLNGKTVSSDNFSVLNANAVLNIYDDDNPGKEGKFTVGYSLLDSGQNPTINIYGGRVNARDWWGPATINVYGGKLAPDSTLYMDVGDLNISGGEIIGVIQQRDGGTIRLSGNPKIDDGKLYIKPDNPIKINGKLDDDARCKVELNIKGGKGLFAVMDDEAYATADNFISVEGYNVVKNGKKLYLTDQKAQEHDGKVFTPWLDTENLPAASGNYYLTDNVTLSEAWNAPEGETNICLNGKTVSAAFNVGDGADLTVYDCQNAGEIASSEGKVVSVSGGSFTLKSGKINSRPSGKGIDVSGGTVTIEGGTVEGSSDSAISGGSDSNIIIKGGTISGGFASGIYAGGRIEISGGDISGQCYGVDAASATEFMLSGTPAISVYTPISLTYADIHISQPVTIKAPLTGGTYSIHMDAPGLFAVMDDEAYAAAENFTSADDGYAVVKNGKKLYLTDQEAQKHDGKVFAPWLDAENLPATGGNYYLTGNVKLSGSWVPTGNVNICLNGKEIDCGSGHIQLTSLTLGIYDCQENAGTITSSAAWGTIFINSDDASVNIYGGNIKNTGTGEGFSDGTGIYNCGSLNIYGGNVSGSRYAVINTSGDGITVAGGTMTGGDYGIWFENDNVGFRLSGSPGIFGSKADIHLEDEMKIDITGKLTGNYTIEKGNAGVFTNGAKDNAAKENFAPSADMAAKGYEVTGQDGEFALTLKTYTITYAPGDGTGTIDPAAKTHGKPAALSREKFARTGYTQVGWTETENGEKTYDFGAEYKDDKDITLYPAWQKNVITLSPAEAEIKVGGKTSITAAVSPVTAVCDPIEWNVTGGSDVISCAVKDDGRSVEITALKAGTVTLTASTDKGETTAECKITVIRTDFTVTLSAAETVTYGDKLTISAAVEQDALRISQMAPGDHVEFFSSGKSLGSAEVTDGKAELTVDVTKDKFGIGENKITAVCGESVSQDGSESDGITVTVKKRELLPSIDGTTFEKVYNGNNSADELGLSIAPGNVVSGDSVAVSGDFAFNSANVKDATTITAEHLTLGGDDAQYYALSETPLAHDGKITPAKVDIPAKEYAYDGEIIRKIELNGVNGEKVSATLTAAGKNAGTYTYGADENGYAIDLDSSNYAVDSAGTLTINPLTAMIKWSENEFDYDGKVKEVTAAVTNAVDGDKFTIGYDGNKKTDAGRYTAKITDLGNDNYTLDGAKNVALSWKISPADRGQTNVKINYIGETMSTGRDMEYSIDGKTWLPCTKNMSVKTVGWNGKESLTVKFRYAADKNHTAGKAQKVTIPLRPAAPDISGVKVTKTQHSITVKKIANCEYSIDGAAWQNSGTFEKLTEGTEYAVRIRTKATKNAFASFAARKEIVTSDNSSGATKLKTGETVETDGGSITNDGKMVELEDKDGNRTTVILPDGTSGSVKVDESGNVSVPGVSRVQAGETTVTLPDGGTVKPDGTIIADKVVVGDTTVSGDEVTVTPDGNIAVPDGGIVRSADGSETVIGKDGSIQNDIVRIEPVGNVDYRDGNSKNYALSNGYIALDIKSADNDGNVKDLESGSDISVRAAYDIRLLYNGRFEVQPNGTVKVTIAAPAGADGTEKVLHVNGNGFEDMNAGYDSNSKTFSFETDHFSIYVIAGAETSGEPTTPPGISQTVPDRPSADPAAAENTDHNDGSVQQNKPQAGHDPDVTENTDHNDSGEDVSSGAKIMPDGEKISEKFENDGSRNVFVYLLVFAIAIIAIIVIIIIIAKRRRKK